MVFLIDHGLAWNITQKSCAVIYSLRFFLSLQHQHFIKQSWKLSSRNHVSTAGAVLKYMIYFRKSLSTRPRRFLLTLKLFS